MARSNFRVEQGVEIHEENGTGSAWQLIGNGAPAGTSGPTDNAPIGSTFQRLDGAGEFYRKKASTSSASDWENMVGQAALDAISGGSYELVAVSAGTPTTVSTCFTSECLGAEWEVVVYETADESKKEMFKHVAIHDGEKSPYVDAAAFDENTNSKLKIGDIAGLTFTSVLTGSGTGVQTIGLEISATAAVTVEVRRTSIP